LSPARLPIPPQGQQKLWNVAMNSGEFKKYFTLNYDWYVFLTLTFGDFVEFLNILNSINVNYNVRKTFAVAVPKNRVSEIIS
jgi:hypothetical protein